MPESMSGATYQVLRSYSNGLPEKWHIALEGGEVSARRARGRTSSSEAHSTVASKRKPSPSVGVDAQLSRTACFGSSAASAGGAVQAFAASC